MITGSMILSIPLWLFSLIFFLYLFKPKPAYQSREKYPIHAVMCVVLGCMFAALAKTMWDGALTLGMILSIPFWISAAVFSSATIGCLREEKVDPAQAVIGLVLTGILAVIAAALVKLL